MAQFLLEYGTFLAKFLTFGLAGLALLSLLAYCAIGEDKHGKITIRHLNKHFNRLAGSLDLNLLAKEVPKKKKKEPPKKSIYVLNFDGDIRASATDNLREEITAILQAFKPGDEVVVKLTSPGGMVHRYGFAASQLTRIKDHNIPLTICVDHVAASGGYMMACVADKLLAAPFAVIGSIGVVAQIPNLHRWLQEKKIDFDVFTAGKYKRTVTVLGENTQEGKDKFQEELESTHQLFKDFIAMHRKSVDLDKLATGETWYGLQAKDHNLVDGIKTSDDYLLDHAKTANIYEVCYAPKKSFAKKLGVSSQEVVSLIITRLWSEAQSSLIFRNK